MKWSYDVSKKPKENMKAFIDEALAEDPLRSHMLLWLIYRDIGGGQVPLGPQYENAFRIMLHQHPLRQAILPLSKDDREEQTKKTRAYLQETSVLLTDEEITAPPPRPGYIPEDAAKKMAADILTMAWDVASGKISDTRMAGRAGSKLGKTVAEIYRKYDAAWLQNPDATALWAGILGVDPEVIAERSRARHGVQELTEDEREILKVYIANRTRSGAGDWRLR